MATAVKCYNLAVMTSTTSGAGTLTLNAAVAPWLTFALAGAVDGDVVGYSIKDGVAGCEAGIGTYHSAGPTLSRDIIISSSNSNAAITCSINVEVRIVQLATLTHPASSIVWNNDDAYENMGGGVDGRLYISMTGWASIRATQSRSSGKYYWEWKVINGGGFNPMIGVGKSTMALTSYPGNDGNGWGQTHDGIVFSSTGIKTNGSAYSNADVQGIGLDWTGGTVKFYQNGTLNGTITGLTISGPYFPVGAGSGSNNAANASWDTKDIKFLPSGYLAWGL